MGAHALASVAVLNNVSLRRQKLLRSFCQRSTEALRGSSGLRLAQVSTSERGPAQRAVVRTVAGAEPQPRDASGPWRPTRAWGPAPCVPARPHVAVAARRGMGFLAEMETLKEQRDSGREGATSPLDFEAPLEVVLYPDPRLRAPNRLVTDFASGKLQRLADEMLDVMYRTDGVGLAAPQVGVNVRLMVYNPAGERGQGQEFILVNPRIVKAAKAADVEVEGCLSFPDMHAEVERPVGVRVEAQDVRGKRFSLSLKGWQARIFQHEYDHLQGTLYFDRMKPEVLDSVRPKLLELEALYEERTQQPRPETVGPAALDAPVAAAGAE